MSSSNDLAFNQAPDVAKFFEDNFLQCVYMDDPDGTFTCDTGDTGFYFLGFHRYRMDFPKFFSPQEAMNFVLSNPIRVFLAMNVIMNHIKFNQPDDFAYTDASEEVPVSSEG